MIHYTDWPMTSNGYSLDCAIGYGSFGVVHSGTILEGPHIGAQVAIKIIELEHFADQNLEEIRKEIQIMRLSSHPNILNYHVCFIYRTQLWMVMPLMQCGSIAGILKHRFPEGIQDESLIASILKEVLQALSYFHEHDQIHRDVKSGNILMSEEGKICLSDFGVASKLRIGINAKTFAGSPCWMAPEVMDSGSGRGYDCKADIWSFGITAIELAKGVPPLFDNPPMKVILLVKNSDPPFLNREDSFDSSFIEMVNLCLQKDPEKRPSAESLLKKKFFSKAKGTQYIYNHLILMLPPIENMLSVPRVYQSSLMRERLGSEAESWDFNISSGNGSKSKNEDPFAGIGNDEGDPLDEIEEFD